MKFMGLLSIALVVLTLFSCLSVSATAAYGFELTNLSDDDVNKVWRNIGIKNAIDITSVKDVDSPIISFDVSDDGNVILGLKDNLIMVLNSHNQMIECFRFETSGTFCVQWQDDNILLLLIRSSIIVELSIDGQLINMVKFDDNSKENYTILNDMIQKNTITVEDSVYQIKNSNSFLNLFSSYSQLVRTDSNGNITTIYDVSDIQTLRTVFLFIVVVMFIALIICTIVWRCVNVKRKVDSNKSEF